MENKYTYSKKEIATYLRDFYRMILIASQNQTVSFFRVFQHTLKEDGRLQYAIKDYYQHMIQVYEYMLILKNFTILYDNKFNYLQENQIDAINIPKNIFVNENDCKRFSKKQIIKFIRNAFNHNDNNDKELIKFIRVNEDGQEKIKAEIFLKNTKPIPFHVILDQNTLIPIMFELNKASTINMLVHRNETEISINSSTVYKELNKIYLRKFFSKKKLTANELEQLNNFIKNVGQTKHRETELGLIGLEYKDFRYTTSQKVKIAEDLAYWESIGEDGNDIIFHLTNKVMPLAYMKERTLIMNLCLTDYYIKLGSASFFDIVKEARKIFVSKECDNTSPLFSYVHIYGIDDNILYDSFDFDNLISITDSIYHGYIYDSLITEEQIEISSTKTIPREKIRNSFVHMRWFKGVNECYKLFDWGNGIDDEFNSKSSTFWSSNIRMIDMMTSAEKYYQKALKNQNENEPFLEEPIHFRKQTLSDGVDIIDCISFLKKSVFYFLNLNPNDSENMYKLYVIDNSQVQRIATDEEAKIFIEELSNLTDKEKNDYKEILEEIPSKIITISTKNSSKAK